MNLNLGCSDRRLEAPWINVDIVPPADVITDLRYWWPWANSTVESVFAHDIFEHLPDKRQTMSELWRVLRNGGKADICVPTAPGVGAWQDPTHASVWTAGDFEYYEVGNYARERFRCSEYYGVKADFRIVKWHWANYENRFGEEVKKFRILLECLK